MPRGPRNLPVNGVTYDPIVRKALSEDSIMYLENLRHRIDMRFAEVDELSEEDIRNFKEDLEGNIDMRSVQNAFVAAVRGKTHGMTSQIFYTTFGNIRFAAGWDNVKSTSMFDVEIDPKPRTSTTRTGLAVPMTRVTENRQKRYDPDFVVDKLPPQKIDDVVIFVNDTMRLDGSDYATLVPDKVLLRFVKLMDSVGFFRTIIESKYQNLDIDFGPFTIHYVKLGGSFTAEFHSSSGDASLDVTALLNAHYTERPEDEKLAENPFDFSTLSAIFGDTFTAATF